MYKPFQLKLSIFAPILNLVVFLMAFTSIPTAQAQEDSVSLEEALQICNRVSNRKDRLDCFEGLATAAAPKTKEESSEKPDKAGDDNVGEIIAIKPEQAPTKPPAKTDIDTPPVVTETEEESSGGGQRFVILTEDEAKERLDEKRTPRQKGENYITNVRKAWRNNERKLMVLMTNGEIWKQIENGTPRIPKAGAEVNFKRTNLGGWFVKFPRHGRSLKMVIINP